MKLHLLLLICFACPWLLMAQPESEPNNSLPTANLIQEGAVVTGSLNSSSDANDYFKSLPSDDGTVKLYFTFSGGTTGSDMTAYVYNKAGAQIGAKSVFNVPGGSDSVVVPCRLRDTVYFRLNCSELYTYQLSYQTVPSGTNDVAPNDNFATATFFAQTDTAYGRVGYSSVAIDAEDYYLSVLPVDGTLRYFIEYNNTSGSTGADLTSYIYNKNQVQIGGSNQFNRPLGPGSDSITVFGRAADTVYFRVSANACFSYNIRYEVLPAGPPDPEPNNTFAEAVFVPVNTSRFGRVGYTSVASDVADYFYAILPDDGTLRYFIDYDNTSGSTGADLASYIYNKNQAQIGGSNQFNRPLGPGSDSITVFGRAADTVFFLVSANASFSYSIRYELLPAGPPDPEPNNTFAEATFVQVNTSRLGRVGYTSVASDGADYFYAILPDDGTLRYFIDYDNTSGSTGADLASYIYNKNQAQIGGSNQFNRPLGPGSDSITVFGRAADTVFFLISANASFSYSIRYELLPAGPPDPEPNNTFAEATFVQVNTSRSGRVGYTSVASDEVDFFYAILPDDGTLRYFIDYDNTSGSIGADLASYIYNKNQAQIGGSNQFNRPLGPGSDSITVFGRAADTVFFLVSANASFSYSIRYELLPAGPPDPEPNNTFAEASYFEPSDTISGRVGYLSVVPDGSDYFSSLLPSDGTLRCIFSINNTSGSTGADLSFSVFDSKRAQIGGLNRFNQPLGQRPTDTLMIYCRAADTVYFRISSSGSFTYSLRYEMIPTGITVTEPISTLATARLISLTDTLRGRVGYDGSIPDDNDYYTFVQPLRGSVRVRLKATNTSNSAGADMAIYVGRVSTSANIFTKSYSNRVPGSWEEEFTMSCLPADSLFLRVAGPSGCFTYEMSFVDEPAEPEVSFETFRTGNEVTFVPKLLRTSSFIWNFDNGTTSTAQFPTVLYTTPANYEVSLIGFNQVCGTRDTASTWVVVKGLEYYTPDSAGAGGDAIMEIYGGGLDTTTQVVLRRNGMEMRPVRLIANPSSNQLSCFFDLHFADEGLYDLEITVPGQDPVLYPGGFRVTDLRYPFCKSEVVGPSVWRINRDTRFTLVVSNTGNVMANGVVTALLWPKNVKLTFDTEWFRPPSSGSYQIAVGDGEIWNLDYADIAWLYDSLNVYTSIDSFQGQPYDGYMQLIQIPRISAQSTYEIPLIIRTATTGTPRLITFTYGPNLYGSGASGSWMDAVPNAAVEFADLLDMAVGETKLANTPIGWLTKATKASTTHLANLGESLAAISLVADGTNETISQGLPAKFDQQVSAGNAQIAKELLDVATDKLVEKGADKLLMGQTEELNRWLANNPDASLASVEFAIENLNDLNNIREAIKDAYKTGKNLNTLKDKLGRLQELAKNCPELQKQLDDLIKELGQDLEQKDPKDKTPRAVTSMDPNAIYGPDGVRGYVKLDQLQYFTVAFENLATASAPAQLVTVYDTLNPAWFDLRSFAFEDVSLAAETYPLPQHRKEFTSIFDLRPRLPYEVLVAGKLDTLTGVITWRFITLDTLSGDLTEDPLGGFLPPNTIAPQGEGTVSYSVRLRSDLPEGTVTLNRAEIIFDENTSLFTNTWRNVVDIQAPVSSISAAAEDSVISLEFQGTDAGSGMARYQVFVSENAGVWLPLVSTYEQTAQFTGTPGSTYAFYIVAQDSVSNREVKPAQAEATVTLGSGTRPDADYALFPNPGTGRFRLTARLPQGDAWFEITDPAGRVMHTDTRSDWDGSEWPFDLSTYTPGLYLLRLGTAAASKPVILKLVLQKS